MNATQVAEECLEHVMQEQDHADQLATRIVQLGEIPIFRQVALGRSHSEYVEGSDLKGILAVEEEHAENLSDFLKIV